MKGLLYYSQADAIKNKLFIEDLQKEAAKIDIDLQLVINDKLPAGKIDFILYRGRDFTRIEQFENNGIPVMNRSHVSRIANHKLRTFELSLLLGVPTVPTKKFKSVKDIDKYPAIVKTVDGHGGNEVFLVHNKEKAQNIQVNYQARELIVQPYIEAGAKDVRVFMLGNEIIGAVKRSGNNSFKSNFTLGGTIEKYILSPTQKQDALTIAKAIKSDYIGIDFLLLTDGQWLLNEIEDPVGARSLYLTHDFSVAEKIMHYIKKKLST